MTTLNISLPDSMQTFINEKVSQGGYATPSDYIRQLVSEDQKRVAGNRLESLVLEGLDSGEAKELTSQDWDELKRRVWNRHTEGNPA
jgi:antitoxin ParD1/3/4